MHASPLTASASEQIRIKEEINTVIKQNLGMVPAPYLMEYATTVLTNKTTFTQHNRFRNKIYIFALMIYAGFRWNRKIRRSDVKILYYFFKDEIKNTPCIANDNIANSRDCWCGNKQLQFFSEHYLLCTACQTLISRSGLSDEELVVKNDTEYYGKDYWLHHQSDDFGFPDIHERARLDLPERCAHWLNTIVKYKLPMAKTLELGCAHGGLVAMMQAAGYDATGLELSPWVVQLAKNIFDIPVLTGPLEEQNLEPETFDIIILMDVLEHLSNPFPTIQKCLTLLKRDGVIVIQTPEYPVGMSHLMLQKNKHLFLEHLKEKEHIYLFSKNSVRLLLNKLGMKFINFERAIFAHYDMFLVASRSPLAENSSEHIETALSKNLQSRLISALLRGYRKNALL